MKDLEDVIIYIKELEKRIETMEWAYERRRKLVNELMDANAHMNVELRAYQEKEQERLARVAQELKMGY